MIGWLGGYECIFLMNKNAIEMPPSIHRNEMFSNGKIHVFITFYWNENNSASFFSRFDWNGYTMSRGLMVVAIFFPILEEKNFFFKLQSMNFFLVFVNEAIPFLRIKWKNCIAFNVLPNSQSTVPCYMKIILINILKFPPRYFPTPLHSLLYMYDIIL